MFLLFLIVACFLESFITTFPLTLVVLLFTTVFTADYKVFIYALIFGLILDLLFLRDVGISSIYFILFIFLIKSYSNKFEIKTPHFIFISSLFGSLFYLLILRDPYFILESLIVAIIALIVFVLNSFLKARYLANRF